MPGALLSFVVCDQGITDTGVGQALELRNAPLTTELYALLTDSLIGIAFAPPTTSTSEISPSSLSPDFSPDHLIALAEKTLDLAYTSNVQLEDLQGQLDCLVKKELLAKWKGDTSGAEKAQRVYVELLEGREKEMGGQ